MFLRFGPRTGKIKKNLIKNEIKEIADELIRLHLRIQKRLRAEGIRYCCWIPYTFDRDVSRRLFDEHNEIVFEI